MNIRWPAVTTGILLVLLSHRLRADASAPEGSTERAMDRVRVAFPQTREGFRLVANTRYGRDDQGRLVPDFASLANARVQRFEDTAHTVEPHFPRSADGAMRVAIGEDPRMFVEVTPYAARSASVRIEDGVVVYPDAYVDTDLVYQSTPARTGEYLLLRTSSAPTVWRYAVRRGSGIATMRRAGESVEAVDAQGVPWLRATPPVAIDRRGVRVTGTLRLEGDDLVVQIDTRGLAFPILVDPDWTPTSDMSFGRFFAGANVLPDGRVLSTGGCSATTCSGDLRIGSCAHIVDTAETLNVTTRTWSQVDREAIPRYFHVAESLRDGRVLIAGGCIDADCTMTTADAEIFDPTDNHFHVTASLGESRAGLASAVLADGRILLAGGCNATGCTGRAEIYDPRAVTLAPAAPMIEARGRAATTVLSDGRVLVVGGCTTIDCAYPLNSAEVYNPSTDRWFATWTMSVSRAGHHATLLADGTVLVGGGCADQTCTTYLQSTEVLDPTTLEFTAGPDQRQPRLGAAALRLADGRVMVTQGCAGRSDCDLTVEAFDPASSTFVYLEPAITPRAFHQVVNHATARMVVAVGGCQPGATSMRSETYDTSGVIPLPDAGPADTGTDASRDAPMDVSALDAPANLDASPADAPALRDVLRDAPRGRRADTGIHGRIGGGGCSCTTTAGRRSDWMAQLAALGLAIALAARRSRPRAG